ncbi:MAG: DUF4960 domain-containing protein [Muribaculaceae bacterium]|nr:DUF4960 domain-containing protein [Muribaculaceae bacterium]
MKKISLYRIFVLLTVSCGLLGACSDFEPYGYNEVPDLQKVSNLRADVDGYVVNLDWDLPAGENVEGALILINGNSSNPVRLDGRVTSYSYIGQPMDEEYFYTVKVLYKGGYVSEGVSVNATVPYVELANVSDVKSSVEGRTVTLTWTLPSATGITGVKVIRDGDESAAVLIDGPATSCVLKGQPMDKEITYTVAAVYDKYYAAKGVSVKTVIPYITPKMGYLMTAETIQQLPDDDERAAAAWFVNQENAELIQPSQLADLDADVYSVIWIEIDRVGLPLGWENLPAELTNAETIAALRQYSANGGSLYLANMATQLTVPLGFVPSNMAPTVYGNGEGGSGDDVWLINPYLGWDFRNGGDQGFYDRTAHAIFKGLVLEDPNNYGYDALPLIGPGQREDHNCMWDCNLYGKGSYPDVIKNFEVTTNSLVLATWGQVRDHCVAGLVEFFANTEHGRCIANGLAAYEWNQNSGVNIYQHNVEQLTANILNYLK